MAGSEVGVASGVAGLAGVAVGVDWGRDATTPGLVGVGNRSGVGRDDRFPASVGGGDPFLSAGGDDGSPDVQEARTIRTVAETARMPSEGLCHAPMEISLRR